MTKKTNACTATYMRPCHNTSASARTAPHTRGRAWLHAARASFVDGWNMSTVDTPMAEK